MQIKSRNRYEGVKLTEFDHLQMARRGISKKVMKKEIKLKQEGAYCVAKLRSQGLWNDGIRRSNLKVLRISQMTPEQRKEYGV